MICLLVAAAIFGSLVGGIVGTTIGVALMAACCLSDDISAEERARDAQQ